MTDEEQPTFRLVIRQEGHVVRVFVAREHTMEDARLVVSMAAIVLDQPGVFPAFKEFLKLAVHAMVEAEGGTVDEIIEQSPPEHERAGHA